MSLAIVSVALAGICSLPTFVGYLKIALAAVALVVVMLVLVKLSLDTLRQFSEPQRGLELVEGEDYSDYSLD